jgi:hypothetical protein
MMERLGIGILELEQRFSLPCPCLISKKCTIYENRFVTCRTFRCQLLKDVEAGDVAEAEAIEIVAKATLWAQLIRGDIEAAGVDIKLPLSLAVRKWRERQGEFSQGARVLLLFGALKALIRERFSRAPGVNR